MSPTVGVAIDNENPWPGLGSFDESAERFFNGRRTESVELRRLVVHAPLTVLFGASGLGKTSLLQAGLFPLLRKENLIPVYVRLDVRDMSAPLIEQVESALQAQFNARRIDAPAMHGDESLWAYLHRAGLELWSEQNQLLTPVFVLDQFEEVFTLGAENPSAIARLRLDLADLIENRMPAALARTAAQNELAGDELSLDSQRYKVILSFREDFLPAVEGWKEELPSILRNRLRLLPMSGEQAFEAVHTTASHLVDEPLSRDIVRFVAAAQEHGAARLDDAESLKDLAVEPALLSLVCHGLNQKRKAQHKRAFDAALLSGTGQAVISDYYDSAVGDLPERVQRFIENELITERGFRKPCDVDDARSVHGVTDHELRLLVDRRLLRIEPQRGTERVELTHDLLTRVVREHRNTQREKARIRRQRRRMAFFAAIGLVLVVLVGVFGRLYFEADAQRKVAQGARLDAEAASREALKQTAITQIALKKADVQRGLAQKAAKEANAARQDAEHQAMIAAGRRLATEALYRFDSSPDHLDVSGALAALSMKVAPGVEGWRALAQVLRLIRPPVELIDHAHSNEVRIVTFSGDGRWLASAGNDGKFILWDVTHQMKKRVLDIQFHPVPSGFGLAVSRDGQWVVASDLNTLYILNTSSGEPPQKLRNDLARSIAFSPDGRHFATALRSLDPVKVQLFERVADHWGELPGAVATTTPYEADSVIFVSNNVLALAGTYGKHSVWFWDLEQKKETFLAEGDRSANFGECRALTLTEDARRLAALCSRGILVADRGESEFFPSPASREHASGYVASWTLSISPDGRHIASEDGVVRVFQLYKDEVARMPGPSRAAAFRPDGTMLAAGFVDGSIALWPTTKGTESIRLASEGPTSTVAFSPDERWLVTARKDGRVQASDISGAGKSRTIHAFAVGANPDRPVFSPDGRFLAVTDQTALYLIQTGIWKVIAHSDLPGAVRSASFSPDGRLLFTMGAGGIRSFDTATLKKTTLSIAGDFTTITFSPDWHFLATLTRSGKRGAVHLTQVWNAATGAEVTWLYEGVFLSAEPPPRPAQGGEQRLISASAKWTGSKEQTGSGHHPLSPDRALKIESSGSTVELKEAASGRTIARLEHDANVVDAVFSPHGRWLATASQDGIVRLWPLQAPEILEQACKLLPRNLTPDEWKELKVEGPYRKTCPNLP